MVVTKYQMVHSLKMQSNSFNQSTITKPVEIHETGKLNVYYLKKIWAYHIYQTQSEAIQKIHKVDWKYINAVFNLLGLGIEPTTKFLILEQPDFPEFEQWIEQHGHISTELIKQFNEMVSGKDGHRLDQSLPAPLSRQDLDHWDKKGYVIIKGAISKEDSQKSAAVVYDSIDARSDDPASWYKRHPLKQGIMVQLFNHPILDKNRISPKIRGAYQQLWQRGDLLVSRDRVSFNPPETDSYEFQGPNLHWDVSLKKPIPYGLQGLLYLSDTKKNQGAFTVIPGFHNRIDSWLENIPTDTHPRNKALLDSFDREPIAGEAGDFIIWNQCLPHGSCPNTSDKPRIVQYINYLPIDLEFQEEWI